MQKPEWFWGNLRTNHDLLVPVIIQEENGQVLMLGYTNEGAFKATIKTSLAHFWSRSRQTLWKKGETSGNTLAIKEIWVDCDRDTLLYIVNANGPVCHTGETSCFHKVK